MICSLQSPTTVPWLWLNSAANSSVPPLRVQRNASVSFAFLLSGQRTVLSLPCGASRQGFAPTTASPSDGCDTLPAADALAAGLGAAYGSAGCDVGLRALQGLWRCTPHGWAAEPAPPRTLPVWAEPHQYSWCVVQPAGAGLQSLAAPAWSWHGSRGSSCSCGWARPPAGGPAWSPPSLLLQPLTGFMGQAGERVLRVLGIPQPGPSAVLSLRPVRSLSPGSAAWAAALNLVSCPRSHRRHGLHGAAGLRYSAALLAHRSQGWLMSVLSSWSAAGICLLPGC